MCTATDAAVPASTGQALAMVRAGLGYLAGCDAGSLGTAAQAGPTHPTHPTHPGNRATGQPARKPTEGLFRRLVRSR